MAGLAWHRRFRLLGRLPLVETIATVLPWQPPWERDRHIPPEQDAVKADRRAAGGGCRNQLWGAPSKKALNRGFGDGQIQAWKHLRGRMTAIAGYWRADRLPWPCMWGDVGLEVSVDASRQTCGGGAAAPDTGDRSPCPQSGPRLALTSRMSKSSPQLLLLARSGLGLLTCLHILRFTSLSLVGSHHAWSHPDLPVQALGGPSSWRIPCRKGAGAAALRHALERVQSCMLARLILTPCPEQGPVPLPASVSRGCPAPHSC